MSTGAALFRLLVRDLRQGKDGFCERLLHLRRQLFPTTTWQSHDKHECAIHYNAMHYNRICSLMQNIV